MSVASLIESVMAESQYLPLAESFVAVVELAVRDREEVLGFLAERPVHTVAMAGLIRDNGFASEHNRGTFYGCRNSHARLEGVHVHPSERGNGTARAYLTRLCRHLLSATRTVCLLANEENERAQRFYRTCGFKMRGVYDTIFLRRDRESGTKSRRG